MILKNTNRMMYDARILIFLFFPTHMTISTSTLKKNTVTEPMIKVLESGNKYRTDEEQEGVAKLIEMLSWLSGAGEKK